MLVGNFTGVPVNPKCPMAPASATANETAIFKLEVLNTVCGVGIFLKSIVLVIHCNALYLFGG